MTQSLKANLCDAAAEYGITTLLYHKEEGTFFFLVSAPFKPADMEYICFAGEVEDIVKEAHPEAETAIFDFSEHEKTGEMKFQPLYDENGGDDA